MCRLNTRNQSCLTEGKGKKCLSLALEKLISDCLFYIIWACNKLTVDSFRGSCFNVLLSFHVSHNIQILLLVLLSHLDKCGMDG